MLHHLYGILERPPLASRLPEAGVDERPVLVRRLNGLVVLSTLVESTPRSSPCTLRRHHDVLAAVTVSGPLFPLPYGVAVHSDDLPAWLATREPRIRAGFRAMRGKVEMRVSVLGLRFGEADVDALQAVSDRVTEAAGVTKSRRTLSGKGGNAAMSLAFLVPRADVSAFLGRIAPIAARAGEVAVVPSGPWPPFAFVPTLDVPPAAAGAPAVPYAV